MSDGLHHVICGPCFDLGHRVALCGTPIDGAREISPGQREAQPCVVCLSSPTLTCPNCGEEISTVRFTTAMKIGMVGKPDRLAVFDTETTGVDVEADRIVTAFVGIMDTATGEFVEKWSWLINPGIEIPKAASDVHGITTERATVEGIDPKDAVYAMYQRLDIIRRQDIAIVAMNASFDFTLLDREMMRHWPGVRPLFDTNDRGMAISPVVFDPMVFDRAIDKYRKGSRKLVDLAAFYGVPVEQNAHDAEADCRMAGRVAIKLLEHSRLQGMSLSEVHANLIPTHYNNAIGLADYWQRNLHALSQEERAKRIEAIRDVRAHAGQWPVRPRPIEQTKEIQQ